jgi:hypothetical protein
MINDIPGLQLPFSSHTTVSRRVTTKFDACREELKEELVVTCQTITISINGWSSKNSVSILGIKGHGL